MKERLKAFIAGALIMLLLVGAAPALAESTKTIEAIFGRVQLVINGTPIAKETLLYDGTTYIPLRVAAEILGKDVTWDSATYIAYIDDKATTPTINATGQVISLTALEILDHAGTTWNNADDKQLINQVATDKQKNIYEYSLAVNGGTLTYQLAGAYSRFTGTVACPADTEKRNDTITSAQVKIYGDGKLLYASNPVMLDTEPQSFDLDISGVDTLAVEWLCEGSNYWKNWGYFATVFDPLLYR